MTTIRKMEEKDKNEVLNMMRVFYASDAVFTNGSEEIFESDVNACVGECPFLEGYVFEEKEAIQGYGMLAKSFSTEFGKLCIWVEDIYVKPEYQGLGIGSQFFRVIEEMYQDVLLRLEVEEENERAVHVYKKSGFDELPYMEMKKYVGKNRV